ncbi:MAG: hypothetical protein M1823_000424 [Watsoniomyces obsoletus]|nr:MAG: hypothetical protein M1823_000424 [Watsoniomyces obsoletus]
MHFTSSIPHIVVLGAGLALLDGVTAAKKPSNSVLLSNVKSITLRNGQMTSHRRVSPIPQLKCVGGAAQEYYEVDIMQCKNQGADYDDNNIQWSCTADLPPFFKLGSTNVICEGYESPNDPYILKGSCGVEYRLIFTKLGQEKYDYASMDLMNMRRRKPIGWEETIFWVIFLGVAGWIIYSIVMRLLGNRPRPMGGNNQPWGGGGGGGGGDDPPPPYDFDGYQPPPPRKTYDNTPSASNAAQPPAQQQQQQGWRPGFWTGVLGGVAGAYLAGNRGGQNQRGNPETHRGGGAGRDVGEGPSGWGGRRGRSSDGGSGSPSFSSSSRYESTGFGSTSRR